MGVASGSGDEASGSGDVASGSGWNLWVWLLGVVVRRYLDFLILYTYPYSCICSFLQQHRILTFCSFKKCFSFFMISNVIKIFYYSLSILLLF